MGGDLMQIEPVVIDENMRKPLVWYLLKEGGLVSFMEALNGHEENFSMQFVNSWENCRLTLNGISFHILKEAISLRTGLAMRGRKWHKVTRVTNNVNLQCFFVDGEELI